MSFSKGWVPSNKPGRKNFSAHLAALASPPLHASVEAFAPPVMDQGPDGSCVGHATACACTTAPAAAGHPLGFVCSPGNNYKLARCVTRAGGATPLTDDGAMPADAMIGVSRWGVEPIAAPTSDGRYSDCEPANVNVEPDLIELEEDAKTLLVEEHQITSNGHQRAIDVALALQAGMPVCVGFFVDTAFENWKAGDAPYGAPVNPEDSEGGGHYTCVLAATLTNGLYVFTVRNSWSASWGANGNFLATEEWLTNPQVSDVYAIAATVKETP